MRNESDALNQIKYRSLAQGAVEALRNAIIRGKLSPGTRLIEQKLATQLSHHPIPKIPSSPFLTQ